MPASPSAARPLETEVVTSDGATIVVEHVPARLEGRARPAGAVMLGHAVLANRRSLDRPRGSGLASELAAHGLHAYVFDVRGHGDSRLPEGSRGFRYEDLLRFEFPAVARLLRERHPGLRVGGVGHSLCGHAGLAWLGAEASRGAPAPLDAFVSIGANVWIRSLEPSWTRWAKKLAVLGVMGGFTAALGRVPARDLRFGSEDCPAPFVEQFLGWTASGRWTSPEGADYLASLERVRTPVLAVLGAGDALLCHPTCGELFHRRLSRAPLAIHTADEVECGFAPDHMGMVTDARSRPLWRRIAGFLAEALA